MRIEENFDTLAVPDLGKVSMDGRGGPRPHPVTHPSSSFEDRDGLDRDVSIDVSISRGRGGDPNVLGSDQKARMATARAASCFARSAPRAFARTRAKSVRSHPGRGRSFSASAMAPGAAEVVKQEQPKAVLLQDYRPYPYAVQKLALDFLLGEEKTIVNSRMQVAPSHEGTPPPMVLNGETCVKLATVAVDGKTLQEGEGYTLQDEKLTIENPPNGPFTVDISVEIEPQNNTELEGLYKSSGNFCSQCEAEGFRRITFYPDRPDVMTVFTTKIVADKEKYPILLSNGNLVEEGELEGGKHFAVWEDPFKKPCYLFALVAGNLVAKEESFTTMSGKKVALRIWTQAHNADKTEHAMNSLIKAMKWDEERFGLEYDLDLFNIVAVDDFNMGAMENKSLNIFNSKYVLCTPETATDTDYERIEGVVGHEYFHNWTGNRVTLRNWFQLSLKEGLTVFRDQEFTSDLNSRSVKRIEDVSLLRSKQFAEDASPLAHPVRPESYIKMDNFYTLTVYEKGSELIRMYQTLLGKDGFRKGMDLYFKLHDGQAVTCDDFYRAMEEANETSLGSFKLWYSQAGTPSVTALTEYQKDAGTYKIVLSQKLPKTQDFSGEKLPQLIPVAVGLVGPDGKDLPIKSINGIPTADGGTSPTTVVLKLAEWEQSFELGGITEAPVPSILRGFSAPVKLFVEYSMDQLKFLFANDSDEFNRWEAGQRLSKMVILQSVSDGKIDEAGLNYVVEAFESVLDDGTIDNKIKSLLLTFPDMDVLIDGFNASYPGGADPVLIHETVSALKKSVATRLRSKFEGTYMSLSEEATKAGLSSLDPPSISRRALQGTCLDYIGSLGDEEAMALCWKAFKAAKNMTDQISALKACTSKPGPVCDEAFDSFYEQWKGNALVLLKWLLMQGASNLPGHTAEVKKLLSHPAFDMKNPNKVYSLLGGFSRSAVNFHSMDGSGYELLADCVIQCDGINAQVAARIVSPFTKWQLYNKNRQDLMYKQLERIAATPNISKNVYEMVSKSLKE